MIKKALFISILLSRMAYADAVWISEHNFGEPPTYRDKDELNEIAGQAVCGSENECEVVLRKGVKYYRGKVIQESNYKDILVEETWTGGDCADDYWILNENMEVYGQYPDNDGIYSWSGHYNFSGAIYSEVIDLDHEYRSPSENMASLFYVPSRDLIIYKDVPQEPIEDDRKDYFYFLRCDKEQYGRQQGNKVGRGKLKSQAEKSPPSVTRAGF